MAVDKDQLAEDIVAQFPQDWGWAAGRANRQWLDALCTGFESMWIAGLLTAGACSLPGPTPHTHTVATLVAATMDAPALALGFTPNASSFSSLVAAAVSAHLIANTKMDILDGCIPHVHSFVVGDFGLDTALAAEIKKTPLTGPGIEVFADGFSAGLISHLEGNASMSLVTHPAQHVLA